jgi:hypothetical protein
MVPPTVRRMSHRPLAGYFIISSQRFFFFIGQMLTCVTILTLQNAVETKQ